MMMLPPRTRACDGSLRSVATASRHPRRGGAVAIVPAGFISKVINPYLGCKWCAVGGRTSTRGSVRYLGYQHGLVLHGVGEEAIEASNSITRSFKNLEQPVCPRKLENDRRLGRDGRQLELAVAL